MKREFHYFHCTICLFLSLSHTHSRPLSLCVFFYFSKFLTIPLKCDMDCFLRYACYFIVIHKTFGNKHFVKHFIFNAFILFNFFSRCEICLLICLAAIFATTYDYGSQDDTLHGLTQFSSRVIS